MKNLKKVLAMVLAFACTFTMFASAKVYEDVQPGSEFSEAITMLSDLGIIQGKTDGKYHPGRNHYPCRGLCSDCSSADR